MSEESWLDALEKQAREAHVPVMLEDGLVFLTGYIAAHPEICSILEAGTAVGISSMRMAGVRDDITVDTLEIDEGMYAQAVENIRDAGLSDRIHVHLCDAVEFETNKQYDLIFIDAAKSQYRNHLEHFMKNTHKHSVFVFDNLNFHGIVDDPSKSHNRSTLQMTRKIKQFRDWLLVEPRFAVKYYSGIGDGIAVAKVVRGWPGYGKQ